MIPAGSDQASSPHRLTNLQQTGSFEPAYQRYTTQMHDSNLVPHSHHSSAHTPTGLLQQQHHFLS